MRITFVLETASLAGGVRVVATYAERLMRRGHEVCVVSQPVRPTPWRDQLRALLRRREWTPYVKYLPSYLDDSPIEHRKMPMRRPVTDADVPDADVIVATWWETAEWVARLSPTKGAKAYFLQHFETWGGPPERVEATWRLPMHKIVISKWLRELAESRFGDPDVSHVPNSVDTELFFAPPRGKQPTPTVGMMFAAVPFKGANDAFAALEVVRRRHPDLKLVMFGKETPTPQVTPPPWAKIEKTPPQKRLRELYAQCDVWLCASHAEGFHLPPLEAMACRCPVVSTRVGGPQDIVVGGANGFLVDVGDVGALADRVERVLGMDAPQWRAMSDAALATATGFTWDDATDGFEAALRRAVEKAPAPDRA